MLGTAIYYTTVGSGNKILVTDSVTHANGGVLFAASDANGNPLPGDPLPGIGDLAWDGSHLWATPYTSAGSCLNVAYEYTLSGTLLKTISRRTLSRPRMPTGKALAMLTAFPLADSQGSFDGFNIANGRIIANEFVGG